MIWPTDNSNQSLLATSRDKSWHINKRQLVFFPIHAHIFWETLAKPIQNHSHSKFISSEMASTTLWSRYEFSDQVKAKVKAMHVLKIHIERDYPNKYYIISINTYIERLSHARCARTIFIHELRWKKKKKTNERALRTGKFVNASYRYDVLVHTYLNFFLWRPSHFKDWKRTTEKIHRSSNQRHER